MGVSKYLLTAEEGEMTTNTLGRERYVALGTRKRDGSWVATPVSIVEIDGRLFFRAYDVSGKARRLRNFPEVRVTPSTVRGRMTGVTRTGTARLLTEAESAPVRAALAAKYPILQGRLVPALHKRKGWTTVHYELTLDSA
jgi:PPOX class probable F420-dependent enzyme